MTSKEFNAMLESFNNERNKESSYKKEFAVINEKIIKYQNASNEYQKIYQRTDRENEQLKFEFQESKLQYEDKIQSMQKEILELQNALQITQSQKTDNELGNANLRDANQDVSI